MLQRFICIFVTSILISTSFGQGSKEDLRNPPQITIHSDIDTIKSIVRREMATDKGTTLLRESPSQLLFKRVPDGGKAFLGQVMNGGRTPYNLVTFTLTLLQDDVQVSLDTNIAVMDQNGAERITGTANTIKKYREQVVQMLATLKAEAEAIPKNVPPKPVEVSAPSKNTLPLTTANTLVFSSKRDGDQEIYLLDLTTKRQVNLTQNSASEDGYPRFSPDGQKIAFSTNRNNNKWQTFLMNRDGSDQQLLTDGGYADWSPDGQSLVFALHQKDHDEIFSISAIRKGRPKQLTFMGKETVHPAWSPDGKKIAFASEKDGNREIYVMNSDGSNLVRLMTNNWYDDYPAWSPDNKQIAFASDRDSHNSDKLEMYVMNADGTSVRRLTNHPADDRHPAWSPDGKRIVFASDRNGNRDIFLMGADGTGGIEQLVSALGDDEHPSWLKTSPSPNPVEASNPVITNRARSKAVPEPSFTYLRDCREQGTICDGSFRASTDHSVQNGGMNFIDFGIEYTSSSDWAEVRLNGDGGWPYAVELTVLKTRQTKNWRVQKNNSGILVTGQGLSVQAKETIKKFDPYMRLSFDQYRSHQIQNQMNLLTSELVRVLFETEALARPAQQPQRQSSVDFEALRAQAKKDPCSIKIPEKSDGNLNHTLFYAEVVNACNFQKSTGIRPSPPPATTKANPQAVDASKTTNLPSQNFNFSQSGHVRKVSFVYKKSETVYMIIDNGPQRGIYELSIVANADKSKDSYSAQLFNDNNKPLVIWQNDRERVRVKMNQQGVNILKKIEIAFKRDLSVAANQASAKAAVIALWDFYTGQMEDGVGVR